MGWLVGTGHKLYENKDAYLRHQCRMSNETDDHKNTILKSAFVGSIWYAAVELKRPENAIRVVAFIFLTRSYRNGEFGYKDMDETVGPCEVNCPMSIMKLLTPLVGDESYASEWRKNVYDYHAAQKLTRGKEAGAIGKRIQFERPLNYGSLGLVEGGILRRVPAGQKRRLTLAILHRGIWCRVKKVDLNSATILDAPAEANAA